MATMDRRLELDAILMEILGSEYVYFDPPQSQQMHYPCIRYSLSDIDILFADNKPYLKYKQYQLTIIDWDPDSELPDKLMDRLPVNFDRPYTADNLHHWVFSLYF